MNSMYSLSLKLFSLFLLIGMTFGSLPAAAQNRTDLDRNVHAAIKLLKETSPAAKRLWPKAKGALVFPNIVKAGFLVAVQTGNGALVRPKQGGGNYIASHYNISAASYGLQAGVKKFGYVMILMTHAAVEHAKTSAGWELGVGPSIVIVDEGMAKTTTSESLLNSDVYAFTFGQEGLMGGMGLQGTKITRLNR